MFICPNIYLFGLLGQGRRAKGIRCGRLDSMRLFWVPPPGGAFISSSNLVPRLSRTLLVPLAYRCGLHNMSEQLWTSISCGQLALVNYGPIGIGHWTAVNDDYRSLIAFWFALRKTFQFSTLSSMLYILPALSRLPSNNPFPILYPMGSVQRKEAPIRTSHKFLLRIAATDGLSTDRSGNWVYFWSNAKFSCLP